MERVRYTNTGLPITGQLLQELITYNPQTGAMRWNTREEKHYPNAQCAFHTAKCFNQQFAGKPLHIRLCAKGATRWTYPVTTVMRTVLGTARIAWACHYGTLPTQNISFKNGDRFDTRLSNLSDVRVTHPPEKVFLNAYKSHLTAHTASRPATGNHYGVDYVV